MTGFRGFQLLVAAVCGALGVGCGQSVEPAADSEAGVVAKASRPRVVVAIIDSGINPYHSFFNEGRPGLESRIYPPGSPPSSVTPEVLAEFGIDQDHILTLNRSGNPQADFAADTAQWAKVKLGEPYWFRGTNIIAVGRDESGPPILPDDDVDDAHGVAVVAAVLAANPDAIVYFIEHEMKDTTSNDAGSEEAHALGFLHPGVDIVSTSYSLVGSLPEAKAWYHTFESVVEMGKLHVSSAGEKPTLTPLMGGAGPWWSIGVSAIYEYDGHDSEQPARDNDGSAYFADFAADFEQTLPRCSRCESGSEEILHGTSLSAPRAAGVASRVLLEARRQLGHRGGIQLVDGVPVMAAGGAHAITNWQLRRALEQAAFVPDMTGYDPTGWPQPVFGLPPAVAPWLLIGWGNLSADPAMQVVPAALAELGLQGGPLRAKDAGFCDFQTRLIQARHAWWDNVAPGADALPDTDLYGGDGRVPPAEDPFVYCAQRP